MIRPFSVTGPEPLVMFLSPCTSHRPRVLAMELLLPNWSYGKEFTRYSVSLAFPNAGCKDNTGLLLRLTGPNVTKFTDELRATSWDLEMAHSIAPTNSSWLAPQNWLTLKKRVLGLKPKCGKSGKQVPPTD